MDDFGVLCGFWVLKWVFRVVYPGGVFWVSGYVMLVSVVWAFGLVVSLGGFGFLGLILGFSFVGILDFIG